MQGGPSMMWFFTHADTAAGSIVITGVYVKQTKEVFQLTWGIKRSAITSKYLPAKISTRHISWKVLGSKYNSFDSVYFYDKEFILGFLAWLVYSFSMHRSFSEMFFTPSTFHIRVRGYDFQFFLANFVPPFSNVHPQSICKIEK